MALKIILYVLTIVKIITYSNAAQSCPTFSSEAYRNYLSPINLNTSSALKITTSTSLTQSNGLVDFLLVKNTGKAIEVYGYPYSITTSAIYGGALCGNHNFYKVRFYFSRNETETSYDEVDGVRAPFVVAIYYYSSNYSSFEEALNYPGGTLLFTFRFTLSEEPNILFKPVEPFIRALKKPGTQFYAPSSLLYGFFYRIPLIHSYYIFPGSYDDLETGKQYSGVIVFVAEGLFEVFNRQQFEAFKSLLDSKGAPLETKSHKLYEQGLRPVRKANGYKGIFALI